MVTSVGVRLHWTTVAAARSPIVAFSSEPSHTMIASCSGQLVKPVRQSTDTPSQSAVEQWEHRHSRGHGLDDYLLEPVNTNNVIVVANIIYSKKGQCPWVTETEATSVTARRLFFHDHR